MKLRMLHDNVLVRLDEEPGAVKWGKVLVNGVYREPDGIWSGDVVAVGPGKLKHSRRNKQYYRDEIDEIEPGDHVHVEAMNGMLFEIDGYGTHMIVGADKIMVADASRA